MCADWVGKIRRGLRKPPRYIVQRVAHEVQGQAERYLAPRRMRWLTSERLARAAGHPSTAHWWNALGERAYLAVETVSPEALERLCPGERNRILAAAQRALDHEVDLLGSGSIRLGDDIDWLRDYKTGHRWTPGYCRDIEYNNLERSSDVKFPWELSRMQWMLPLAQAYRLTNDDRYALAARKLIESWIGANPYAATVNWSCTMDVALRILSWTALFHGFKESAAWSDQAFRDCFLQSLFLHGDFTARHLEKSDVNGNHYTADAAGLVFAGLFFGGTSAPRQWLDTGWDILCSELKLQVFDDGVDFEASVPYHRLVLELFLLPALYRKSQGLSVPDWYRDRLLAMARFTAAYSRPDGSVPLWGDADDGRALPLGGQRLNDHRYLLGLTGLAFGAQDLVESFAGPRSEVLWLLGASAAAALPGREAAERDKGSSAFPAGGFFVLRNRRDHVFVDCGPVGLAGRGGHGHNDLLSFEAVLEGVHLVTDCGAYLYTADFRQRNLFRSTAFHNTPKVDGEEINRFIRARDLWQLRNDAPPEVRELSLGCEVDRLVVSHGGYRRFPAPLTPVRTFELRHDTHRLTVTDAFEGSGPHEIEIPLHLAIGVEFAEQEPGRALLCAGGRCFSLTWNSPLPWIFVVESGRVSPSYGVVHEATVLKWRRTGPPATLTLAIAPLSAAKRSTAQEERLDP